MRKRPPVLTLDQHLALAEHLRAIDWHYGEMFAILAPASPRRLVSLLTRALDNLQNSRLCNLRSDLEDEMFRHHAADPRCSIHTYYADASAPNVPQIAARLSNTGAEAARG